MVKMKSKAHCPQLVPTVGEVLPEGIFEVSEERAKDLEKGLFERVIENKVQLKPEIDKNENGGT